MLDKKLALSIREVAEALGVHPNTIRRCIADGTLPARRLRGRVLIPVTALSAWLNGDDVGSPGQRGQKAHASLLRRLRPKDKAKLRWRRTQRRIRVCFSKQNGLLVVAIVPLIRFTAEKPDTRAMAEAQEAQDASRPRSFLETVFRAIQVIWAIWAMWEKVVRPFLSWLAQVLSWR